MSDRITLEPQNIRDFWDEILPGLLEIKERWPAANTWRPEDVYAEVVNGNAVLYRTEDGWAICTLETDRWTGQSDLFIWLAYAHGHKRGGILKKYLPSFIEVAESLGCTGIQTASANPALESLGGNLYTVYRYGW